MVRIGCKCTSYVQGTVPVHQKKFMIGNILELEGEKLALAFTKLPPSIRNTVSFENGGGMDNLREEIVRMGDVFHPLHILLADVACEDSRYHCKKMRFGAVATDNATGEILATSFNRRRQGDIFCEGDCVRTRIESRSDPTIGGCDHAFIVLLSKLYEKGVPLNSLQGTDPRVSLFEAGFLDSANGWTPWLARPDDDGSHRYTCISCPPLLLNFGITEVKTWKINGGIPRITTINLVESLQKDSVKVLGKLSLR